MSVKNKNITPKITGLYLKKSVVDAVKTTFHLIHLVLSRTCQTYKMKLFTKRVADSKCLSPITYFRPIFAKNTILDV